MQRKQRKYPTSPLLPQDDMTARPHVLSRDAMTIISHHSVRYVDPHDDAHLHHDAASRY
jgi:hypothetical protein